MKLLAMNRLSAVVLAVLLMFAACSKSGSGYGGSNNNNNNNTTGNAPNTVYMAGMAFSPGALTVASGTTVTFMNNDNVTHTVTDDNGTFDSGNVAPGQSYKRTFTASGTVSYHCKIHANMKGTVTVSP